MTVDDDSLWIYEDLGPSDVRAERHAALGLMIEWAAVMEECLRTVFCSLIGSEYAVVVAGGQGVEWPVDNCKAVVKVHREIDDEQRAEIKAALEACSVANQRRNTLVHGLKVAGRAADGSFQNLRSRRGTHVQARQSWTTAEAAEAAKALRQASVSLTAAVEDALPDMAAMHT